MNQSELAKQNRIAWEADSYAAWVKQYGLPSDVAKRLQANPIDKLRRLIDYLPELNGLKIANPLGSHGRIAAALALLGANVTVFDLSESNEKYASELFAAASVEVDYVLGDFQSTAYTYDQCFDAVVMELGVLHYFADLNQFVAAVRSLVSADGLLVLNEFHPLLRKAISADTDDILLIGDYFSSETESAETPYQNYVSADVPSCLIRRWNLGEVVTAFAAGGFIIEQLIEHPSSAVAQLPGTFTLVAKSA